MDLPALAALYVMTYPLAKRLGSDAYCNFGALASEQLLWDAYAILLGHAAAWFPSVLPSSFQCREFGTSRFAFPGSILFFYTVLTACVIMQTSELFVSIMPHNVKGSSGSSSSVLSRLMNSVRLQVYLVHELIFLVSSFLQL